jgi:PAS domain S-box-containing protein
MDKGKTHTEQTTLPAMPPWPGYIVAVAGTALAALISWPLTRAAAVDLPLYLAFYPVIFAAAVVGGAAPGMLATILGGVTANLIFLVHGGRLEFGTAPQMVRLGLFLATNVAISLLGDRLRRTAAVRENEARLRNFIEQAPVGIAMFDTRMRYLAASRLWLTAYSVADQDVVGRSEYEVFPELPERWKQVHQRVLAGAVESAEEDLFERADGRRQWVRWEARPWYAAAGVIGGLVIFSEEITARVEATEALRLSEERFRTMANAIPQLAWIARPDGYIFWLNQRCYEYTGATPEQLEGWAWQSFQDPQLLPKVLEQWRRNLATGEALETEFPLRGANGAFRLFLSRVMPLKDHQGRVMLWFGTHTDITELKRLQEHLEEAVHERTARLQETLGELEQMSYSMVHDMRAPLRAMQGYAEMLREQLPDCRRHPGSDYIQHIGEAANRLDRLITDALNYNRVVREALPITAVDLGVLLLGIVRTYPNLQPPAADITVEPAPQLLVLGNESLLTQCFGNLLDNAVKFVGPSVHPRIRIWTKPSMLNQQPSTIIYVTDNGIGIPKEAQKNIFRMFQRLHSERDYPGTGIGLTIVKKAVQRMGGRLGLESEPGRGSTFWVELLRAIQAPEPGSGRRNAPGLDLPSRGDDSAA